MAQFCCWQLMLVPALPGSDLCRMWVALCMAACGGTESKP